MEYVSILDEQPNPGASGGNPGCPKPGAHERNWQRQMACVTFGTAELLSCARNFPTLLAIPDRKAVFNPV
jgi:hypothetical protein